MNGSTKIVEVVIVEANLCLFLCTGARVAIVEVRARVKGTAESEETCAYV